MNENKVPENKAYKVTIILLVGLAAFSTAMKDLNRLQEMVSSFHGFTSRWQGTDLVTLNEKRISTQEAISTTESCPNSSREQITLSDESGLRYNVAQVRGIEIETIDYENVSPEVGANVEAIGSQKLSRLPHLARAKFAPARNSKEQAFAFAKRRNGHFPAHFEFKTSDRRITLDLPITMFTDIKREGLETGVSPDFSQSLPDKTIRKQLRGKSDDGKREFLLKRFERIFNSRRAS